MFQDKLIHKDEFRLRVLLTNDCNKKCHFCLNDFQSKKHIQYANTFDLNDCIRAYGQFMKSIGERSIITFSGGEPGIHPTLPIHLRNAKVYCDVVKVVTNGSAFHIDYKDFVDHWHFGVTDNNQRIIDISKYTKNMLVQIVVTDSMSVVELVDRVSFYHSEGILVKLFSDFHAKNKDMIEAKMNGVMESFGPEGVCTRFTGIQINRGKACEGCQKECVTLKALWYFPDGTSSTCPQGMVAKYDDDSWDKTMEKAYAAHQYYKRRTDVF